MAPSSDLIDFEVIESQKENIQALPSGRSAKALATLYSPPSVTHPSMLSPSPQDTQSLRNIKRQAFEEELTRLDEADDPLDVYDRYVKWALDAYPSASATKESGLLQLLERATKAFLKDESYKNDARYLKLWLLYIKLFCQGSDSATKGPTARDGESARDTYVFLSRHGVGQSLALFYESFAEWLELKGRWQQAAEVWQLGIERNARPAERLNRKMMEFETRREARGHDGQGPSSPALPTVRPALGIRRDPFSTSAAEDSDPQAADRERERAARAAGPPRGSRRPKLEVFADSDENGAPKMGTAIGAGGWENISGAHDRKKENVAEAQPWNGQKLDGGKKLGGLKMQVFKDPSRSKSSLFLPSYCEKQTSMNTRTGKPECVFVNLEAVYPRSDRPSPEEFSFEELRADAQGWLTRDWHTEPVALSKPKPTREQKQKAQDKKGGKGLQIFIDEDTMSARRLAEEIKKEQIDNSQRTVPLKDAQDQVLEDQENNENIGALQSEVAAKAARKAARREEKANRTRKIRVMEVRAEPQTVQANLASPTGPKLKRKKSAEPTMTICTKEAMEEIYDIFNQETSKPDEELAEDGESESSEEEDEDDDDDCTSVSESTGTGHLSCTTSEFGDETAGCDFTVVTIKSTDDEGNTGASEPITAGWTAFTEVKDLPDDGEATDGVDITGVSWSNSSGAAALQQESPEEVVTPTSPELQQYPDRFVPIPPEDCQNAPTHPYRSQFQAANNRLPFMTPIVEKTETSLGAATALAEMVAEKDFMTTKTPCRQNFDAKMTITDNVGEPWSSPFDEDTKEMEALEEIDNKIPQLALPKPTKTSSKLALNDSRSIVRNDAKMNKPLAIRDATPKGPIIKDTQCNPVDEHIRRQILETAQISSFEGYYDHRDQTSGRGHEIKKYTKTVAKTSKNASDKALTNPAAAPQLSFRDSDRVYAVKRELGQGAFAPVYLAESRLARANDETDENAPAQMGKGAYGVTRGDLEAIKMEDPPTAWEFYIMRLAGRRLGVARAVDSIVHAYEMHLFQDEGFLIEEYRDQGTLLNLVNIARADASGPGVMDEMLALFFTVELLRTVEALHSKGLIHGDLKADNILVRLPPASTNFSASTSDSSWSSQYYRDGTQGWTDRGIALIDFGRGIDMKAFIPEVQFIADWKTSEADCAEMREMRPWTYQVDYHGLAGTIHTLLFGKYIETVAERGSTLGAGATKTYKLREGLKRYWQTDIWTECFDLLLNPLMNLEGEEGRKMPLVKGMRTVREKMESYLENNCEKGPGLRGMLRRFEGSIKDKRR